MTPLAMLDNLPATFVTPSLTPSLISYKLGATQDEALALLRESPPKKSSLLILLEPSNRVKLAFLSNQILEIFFKQLIINLIEQLYNLQFKFMQLILRKQYTGEKKIVQSFGCNRIETVIHNPHARYFNIYVLSSNFVN